MIKKHEFFLMAYWRDVIGYLYNVVNIVIDTLEMTRNFSQKVVDGPQAKASCCLQTSESESECSHNTLDNHLTDNE